MTLFHLPRSIAPLALVAALAGCATAQRPDPIEPFNRKVFAFNEGADRYLLKPVAQAYEWALPQFARNGIHRFFANLKEPWSALNLALQGRFRDSASDIGRFATNTTVGLLGFLDPATGWGMPRHGEDFGQTLGVWGVESGAYLVLPLFGPSTVRDTAALPADYFGRPLNYVNDDDWRIGLTVVEFVDRRAALLPLDATLNAVALDKYSFVRDAYLQRRRSQINDAEPRAKGTDAPPVETPAPLP